MDLIDGQLPGRAAAASLKDQTFAARRAIADGTGAIEQGGARPGPRAAQAFPASVLWSRLVPGALFAQGLW